VRFAGSFAKAEREILRQRLQVANQRLATLEQEADDSTKLLASICAFGQNVLAIGRRVRTDNDLEVWRGYLERFNDALESAMTNTLDVHENTLVRHADPEGIEFEHPFNEYHSEEWRKLKRRVQALEKIIERRRK